jgi:O-antigen/teichoic acid export membrane protein
LLGPEKLGYCSFVMFVVTVAGASATGGMSVGAQKYAAEALGRGDPATAMAVLRLVLRWQSWMAAWLVTLGTAIVFVAVPPGHRAYAVLAVLSIGPVLVQSVFTAGIAAAERLRDNVWPSLVSTAINVMLTAVALLLGWDLVGLTLALLVSRVVDCVLRGIAFHRVASSWSPLSAAHDGSRAIAAAVAVPDDLRRRLLGFARDMTLLVILGIVVWDRSEIFVLKHFSAVTELAFYSLAFNIVRQMLMVPRVFVWAVSARLFAEHGRTPARGAELTATSMRYLALFSIPACLGLAALAAPVVCVLYGSRYLPAVPVLAVVASLSVLRSLSMPAQDLVMVADRQALLLWWAVGLALLNIMLDLWWIPAAGAMGAAWANGTAQTIGAIGLLAYASRRLNLKVPWSAVGWALLASTPMAVAVLVIVAVLPPLAAIAAALPAGVAVYLVALRWLGVFGPVDRARFLALVPALPSRVTGGYARLVGLMVPSRAA